MCLRRRLAGTEHDLLRLNRGFLGLPGAKCQHQPSRNDQRDCARGTPRQWRPNSASPRRRRVFQRLGPIVAHRCRQNTTFSAIMAGMMAAEVTMKDNTARVEEFFSGLFVECWRKVMPEEVTEREADFLQRQLQLSPGARVLDVPCGTGRHSCALATRGYQLTGVDLSSTCLNHARDLATSKRLSVTWEHRDMSDLPWNDAFDAAFSMGNSFGYADDDHDARFLRAVFTALKPGGRFVLDYPAVAEALLPAYQERMWVPVGDMLFLREGRYDHVAGRIETRYTLIRDGKVETKPWTQRVYTYREICRLLAAAGFTDPQGYGSLTAEPFKLGSRGLFLVAQKREV